ncbi:dermonecrotic toxin domain-containing protein, partial [Pseudomonas viridiflava]|uniref:dermonecrotic toxin domain-containing protein n=1 Tax=Pseudomonas viridiflava TaxID=33069 RepID=UPI00311E0A1D
MFELAGHASRDMLLITDADGRQILYTAGAEPAFQRFANERALYQWLQSRIAQPADRADLVSHFVREEKQTVALGAKLAKLFAKPWSADQT